MACEPNVDAVVGLRDGRRMAYCEWGAPDGWPIVLCHGAPGSRVFSPDPGTTAEAGVRLITVDRPGYGGSDPELGRQILDWPGDVDELATALHVGEFDVAAHSSGGPYALACAYRFPERVRRVALISCIAPYSLPSSQGLEEDDELTRLAREDLSRASAQFAESVAWLAETPERFLDLPRPEPDQQLLTDPAIRSMFEATIRAAVEQGVDAYGWDCALERRSWGFPLDAIAAEVWIFQGELDRAVEPSQARVLASNLPGSHVRLFADAGHGLILSGWKDILSDLGVQRHSSGRTNTDT